MRILDRYLAGQYVVALLSCATTLVALYVGIDLFSKIGDFMSVKGRSVVGFALAYYACRVPEMMFHISPVVTLVAAILMLVRLARNNELVPIVSSGTSMFRVLAPVLGIGGLVAVGMAMVEEYLLPSLSDSVQDTRRVLEGSSSRGNIIVSDRRNNVIVAKLYDPRLKRMEGMTLLQTGDAGGLILEIKAARARWDEGQGVWIASDGVEYVFAKEGKRLGQHEFGEDGKRLVTEVTPESIVQKRQEGDYLTFAELREEARERRFETNLTVRLQEKITFPLFNPLLLALGLPFVLRAGVRNLFVGGGICVVVCAVFFGSYFLLSDLGSKGEIDPVVSAWLPVVFYGGLGIYLLDTVPT